MSDLSWLNPTPHAIAVYASQPLSPAATHTRYQADATPYLGRTSTGWIAPALPGALIQLPRTALFARFSATSGGSDFSLALIVGFGLRPSRRGPADDGGKLIVRHCIQLGVQLRLH
jgi:hypothetical protein